MPTLNQKLNRLAQYANQVKSSDQKSLPKQMLELSRLRRLNPSCTTWDYYHFRLYQQPHDDQALCWRDYSGQRINEALNRALNPRSAVSAAWDKLQLTALLAPCKLPTATVTAVYKPHGGIPLDHVVKLCDVDALRIYLRTRQHYPMFAKPCYSQQGIGAFLFAEFDATSDTILLGNGKTLTLDNFINQHICSSSSDHYRPEAGYLFQQVLQQHPALTAFQGSPTISGFRVVVLNTETGPQVFRALWKIATGRNTHDNFSMGAYGNLVGQIDLASGRMPYAVDAPWPAARAHEQHPDTGQRFAEFAIPHWPAVLELARTASSVFPLMKILHWDIVLGEQGPVILELNDLGSIPFHQLCGQGFLDETMRAHLHQHGQIPVDSYLAQVLGQS
jgi:hypothetical protein